VIKLETYKFLRELVKPGKGKKSRALSLDDRYTTMLDIKNAFAESGFRP
jgi:hypothetical protein